MVSYYRNCKCAWVLRGFTDETQFQLLKKAFIKVMMPYCLLLSQDSSAHVRPCKGKIPTSNMATEQHMGRRLRQMYLKSTVLVSLFSLLIKGTCLMYYVTSQNYSWCTFFVITLRHENEEIKCLVAIYWKWIIMLFERQ